jgi:hypothetical protein
VALHLLLLVVAVEGLKEALELLVVAVEGLKVALEMAAVSWLQVHRKGPFRIESDS